MNGFSTVIPAKAGIQWPKSSVSLRKCSLWRCLDSGFRRRDGVGISYAIALTEGAPTLDTKTAQACDWRRENVPPDRQARRREVEALGYVTAVWRTMAGISKAT